MSSPFACDPNRSFDEYFCISPEMAPNSLISEVDFYEIPETIISLFTDEIENQKFKIQLNANWANPFFGAGVSFYNRQFNIMLWGGMTRMNGMNKSAYATIVCHELGHIIGGAPYSTMEGREWSSLEGQADFFAASVCLPRYFKSIGVEEKLIKDRIEKSGYDLFIATKNISSETRDQKLVRWEASKEEAKSTLQYYPSIQCRYENYRNNSVRPKCWFKE